jgi:hypothetical protein
MQLLTHAQFAGCLNETFVAELNEGSINFQLVETQLVEARQAQNSSREASREPFSLLFLNTAPVLFPQQIYRMRHPRLGEVGIFMVPIAQSRDGFIYQAIFN